MSRNKLPFIEPRHDLLVRVCSVSGVDIHTQSVKLLQGIYGLEQQHHRASALDCFNDSAQSVRSNSLKVLRRKLSIHKISWSFIDLIPIMFR